MSASMLGGLEGGERERERERERNREGERKKGKAGQIDLSIGGRYLYP